MSHAEATDEALILGVKASDEGATAALLERYWERSYRCARQLTGDPATAEDVAQETFLRVIRAADRFDATRAFRPWFFKILETTAREHQRGARRRSRHEARAESLRPGEEGRVEANEEALLVREELAKLSETHRTALTLRYFEGLPLAEVALVLDCSEGTVSSRIRRGLDALREALAPALAVTATALVVLIEGASSTAGSAPAAPTASSLLALARSTPPPRPSPSPAERGRRQHVAKPLLALAVASALGAAAWWSAFAPAERPATGPLVATPSSSSVTEGAPRPEGKRPDAAPPSSASVATKPGAAVRSVRGHVTVGGNAFAKGVARLRKDGSDLIEPKGFRFEQPLDASGRFSFEELDPTAKSWLFEVEAAGQRVPLRVGPAAAWKQEVTLERAEVVTLEVELLALIASGVVRDRATRAPLGDARVTHTTETAAADGAGRFVLVAPVIPSFGPACLSAHAPGHATAGFLAEVDWRDWKPVTIAGLELELDRGLALRGRVVDERGAPIDRAHVSVSAMIPTTGLLELSGFGHGWGTLTAPDGTFTLDGLTPDAELGGKARVTVRAWLTDAEQPYERALVVGDEPLEIRLTRRVDWSGTVVGANGAPLADASVVLLGGLDRGPGRFGIAFVDTRAYARDSLDPGSGAVRRSGGTNVDAGELRGARTDRRGRFAFTDVPSGEQRVLVRAAGHVERCEVLSVPDVKTFTLAAARTIRGRVTLEGGLPVRRALLVVFAGGTVETFGAKPLLSEKDGELRFVAAGAHALFQGVGPAPVAAAVTDAEGRFEVDGLPEGRYDVALSTIFSNAMSGDDEPEVPRSIDARTAVAAGGSVDFEVKREPSARFEVEALAAEDGAPLERAHFFLVEGGKSTALVGERGSKKSGRWTATTAASHEARVVIEAPGRVPQVVPFAPREGQVLDLGVVRLAKGGAKLDLRVKRAADRATVVVFVRSLVTGRVQRVDFTGPANVHAIESLPPGRVEVRAYVCRGAFPDQKLAALDPVSLEVGASATLELDASGR